MYRLLQKRCVLSCVLILVIASFILPAGMLFADDWYSCADVSDLGPFICYPETYHGCWSETVPEWLHFCAFRCYDMGVYTVLHCQVF